MFPLVSAATIVPVLFLGLAGQNSLAALLVGGFFLGLGGTAFAIGVPYVSSWFPPWFRSILTLQPEPHLMASATLGFQLHALAAFALFAFWPFSRLVHVFSMPLGYLTRPYIVYRSRDTQLGTRRPPRGWERVR